ncbi:MAG: extracellular solute-binding protein [Kiritimatiellae bacterium]|nr:extracellular solute-binding protein [Kiritimatiellia bacterium]
MKKLFALVLAVMLLMSATAALAAGSLVVYSPHDADPLNAGVAMFQAAYPDIDGQVIAAGTGELCQRIVAESANPQGDVLWGGGADTLAGYVDYFAPYVCANDAVIGDAYKDAADMWIGESPLPMVIIYNKSLIAEEDVPKTWDDLCNENLKGKIAYASPAKSGSAYTQLCTMLFSKPTVEEGWDMVFNFIKNLDGKVQDSSGNCHKLVASGEYAIGVTIEKSAVLYNDNPNIGYVYPAKNSAVPDGVALVKNCPNPDNAKLFIDFVTGLECQTAQNKDWARRPVRSDLVPEGLVGLDTLDLGNYDFAYAAKNKAEIVEKWNDLTIEAEE